ncbi:peptidoglycan/LPS O-acetylase OafA/YrhL [Sphingomonas sp. PP-CE-1A-559]|uniref:acyltransferase family protein n=1 Tax=Sphingomonas sp. PP-CE-1A-559 TaxID=2135657 RepID=UPI0010F2DB50|nr:acyltransferase [Sphingomonas sp. PP-CE-1A-559]TCP91896.1 peptidoglycan/LPS O-acetylase OafA/YrhL [Sphingomonas sp. PP-CE-1A-559]
MGKRLEELDGLRGIAAAMVFIGHAVAIAPPGRFTDIAQTPWIAAFYQGHAPVYLFFVLSGFVLSLPFLQGGRPMNYGKFFVQRVFRIYPAYLTALAFALAAIILYDPARMAGVSEWGSSFWTGGIASIPATQIVRHVLLVPQFNSHLINPPVWSMTIEMRMSLVVPALILVQQGARGAMSIAVLAICYCLAWIDALYFLPMFALGALMARHWQALTTFGATASRFQAAGLLALALVLYSMPMTLPESASTWTPHLAAIGSAIAIVLASSRNRLTALLQSKPIDMMGKLSYSFYLLHFPVLLLSVCYLRASVGLFFAEIVAAVVTFGLSWVSYTQIEKSAIGVGKSLWRRLSPPPLQPA